MNKDLKPQFETVLAQRFFIAPAFEIYGGVAGLYDLGPQGTGLRQNIINMWRDHFVIADDLQEVQCTAIVPEKVLIASGHVAKFADIMLRDSVKRDQFVRADTYLEGVIQHKIEELQSKKDITDDQKEQQIKELTILLNQLDGMDVKGIQEVVTKYDVKSPLGNLFEEPKPFNLMFQTLIGPSGGQISYLRPETAQGIFMNFKRCFNNARQILPFGVAQVGTAFRNEIAPRNGLLRAREFEQAEIEFFVNDSLVQEFIKKVEDHLNTKTPSFDELTSQMPRQLSKQLKQVKDVEINIFTEEQQLHGTDWTYNITIEQILLQGIIKNPYLLYYIAKTAMFLYALGLKKEHIRFRQHLKRQLAHYARDCWDADCLLVYGWTEIVGVADRSAYDLDVHSKGSGQELKAFIQYSEPIQRELYTAKIMPKALPIELKQKIKELKQRVETNDQEFLKQLNKQKEQGNEIIIDGIVIPNAAVEIKLENKKIAGESVTPSVIEPSFGIGRLLYSVLEHSFYVREEDTERGVFAFQITTAPIKIGIICLLQKQELVEIQEDLVAELRRKGIVCKTDDTTAQIGKKYAKIDELGIPFTITIDFDTVKDKTVTVRERDSMKQIRVPIQTALDELHAIIKGQGCAQEFFAKYPQYVHAE